MYFDLRQYLAFFGKSWQGGLRRRGYTISTFFAWGNLQEKGMPVSCAYLADRDAEFFAVEYSSCDSSCA